MSKSRNCVIETITKNNQMPQTIYKKFDGRFSPNYKQTPGMCQCRIDNLSFEPHCKSGRMNFYQSDVAYSSNPDIRRSFPKASHKDIFYSIPTFPFHDLVSGSSCVGNIDVCFRFRENDRAKMYHYASGHFRCNPRTERHSEKFSNPNFGYTQIEFRNSKSWQNEKDSKSWQSGRDWNCCVGSSELLGQERWQMQNDGHTNSYTPTDQSHNLRFSVKSWHSPGNCTQKQTISSNTAYKPYFMEYPSQNNRIKYASMGTEKNVNRPEDLADCTLNHNSISNFECLSKVSTVVPCNRTKIKITYGNVGAQVNWKETRPKENTLVPESLPAKDGFEINASAESTTCQHNCDENSEINNLPSHEVKDSVNSVETVPQNFSQSGENCAKLKLQNSEVTLTISEAWNKGAISYEKVSLKDMNVSEENISLSSAGDNCTNVDAPDNLNYFISDHYSTDSPNESKTSRDLPSICTNLVHSNFQGNECAENQNGFSYFVSEAVKNGFTSSSPRKTSKSCYGRNFMKSHERHTLKKQKIACNFNINNSDIFSSRRVNYDLRSPIKSTSVNVQNEVNVKTSICTSNISIKKNSELSTIANENLCMALLPTAKNLVTNERSSVADNSNTSDITRKDSFVTNCNFPVSRIWSGRAKIIELDNSDSIHKDDKDYEDFRPLDPSKYKTELCRAFQIRGTCRYGNRCNYAHGLDQLKVSFHHGKYKTRNCQAYHETGYCRYGARCSFIHDLEEGILKCSIANKEILEALHHWPEESRSPSATVTWKVVNKNDVLDDTLAEFAAIPSIKPADIGSVCDVEDQSPEHIIYSPITNDNVTMSSNWKYWNQSPFHVRKENVRAPNGRILIEELKQAQFSSSNMKAKYKCSVRNYVNSAAVEKQSYKNLHKYRQTWVMHNGAHIQNFQKFDSHCFNSRNSVSAHSNVEPTSLRGVYVESCAAKFKTEELEKKIKPMSSETFAVRLKHSKIKCYNFHYKGYCLYGNKCQYEHDANV